MPIDTSRADQAERAFVGDSVTTPAIRAFDDLVSPASPGPHRPR